MSETKTRTETAAAPVSAPTARRVAALASALFAAALFVTVASVNVPHDASDAELLSWWQQSSHRTSGLVSGLSAVTAAILFAVVLNYVRSLRAAARAPQWLAFTRSMAGAVTALWLVTGAGRATIPHLVDVMGEPLPAVDVLRFGVALNYVLLGLSGMAALGLAILAVSVVVLSTQALGRWVGYVGAACALVILVAVAAQMGSYATPVAILWALCLAVAIWRQPQDATPIPETDLHRPARS
jgi:hypothetical protein